jgi:hypothetical protein
MEVMSLTRKISGASINRLQKEENKYIEEHGFEEYGNWYLGVDTDEKEDTKGRYKFPHSDFVKVHRCGVIAAETSTRLGR